MNKAIGIDLGTTFSVAAYAENQKVEVIPSREGGSLIPSVVAFSEDGSYLVGKLARTQAAVNPMQTISSIKRWMGEGKKIKLNGRIYTPQQISSFILKKVKKEAEEFLGHEIEKAVITVPAYFNDNQRQATMEAAILAELEVMRLINEPTAASLAYGLQKEDIHHALVWDLGGGTFDVSILELGQGVFEVKAVNGDTHLGGDDWDKRIMDYLADEFNKIHEIDLRDYGMSLQRLKEASERAKIELSNELATNIRIPFIIKNRDLETILTREKFEGLTMDLVKKLIPPTEQALRDAALRPQDIHRVILVGGSTRMPSIQQQARELFGKEPYKNINPDEVVAMGAAIQAGILAGEIIEVTLIDVTPLSLGIETTGGIFAKIIERNTPIPCTRSQIFSTAKDDQTQVDIHILQGERALAQDNISLGKFTLDDIPLARRGEPQIEVTFHIDANGILRTSALDLYTENQKSLKPSSSKRLSNGQINRMLEDARIHAEEDEEMKERIQAGIWAESMISSSQIFMKENFKILEKSQIDQIVKTILQVKTALVKNEGKEINSKTHELKKLLEVSHDEIQGKSTEYKRSLL